MSRGASSQYAVSLALAAALALAGCSNAAPTEPANTSNAGTAAPSTTTADTPTPTTSPPASTSTTSTPTTAPTTDPNIPEAARQNSHAGAEAFTLYFFGVINRSFAETNPDLLTPLVLSTCKTCAGMTSAIEEYRSKNFRYVGEYVSATNITWATDSAGVTKVLASTDQKGAKVLNLQGRLVREVPPSRGNLSVQLRYDSGWRIAEIQAAA